MSDHQIYTLESPEDTLLSCAQHLSQLLARYSDQEIFLLVSGGSALHVLDAIETAHVGPHVRMCVIDERYGVVKEDQNYYQLSQTDFARRFIASGGMVCDTSLDDCESLKASEDRFGAHIGSIMDCVHDQEVVVVSFLGIGTDGHTAGIMPYPDDESMFNALFDGDSGGYVVGYDAGDKSPFPHRVTVNMRFLREGSAHTVVYAVGSDKQDALRASVGDVLQVNRYPAQIIHEMKDVHIYTDQEITK